jgi:hypothetical protein
VDRKVGYSKMSKKIVFEALRRVWAFRIQASEFRRRQPRLTQSVPHS